jgi:hypothetical protein
MLPRRGLRRDRHASCNGTCRSQPDGRGNHRCIQEGEPACAEAALLGGKASRVVAVGRDKLQAFASPVDALDPYYGADTSWRRCRHAVKPSLLLPRKRAQEGAGVALKPEERLWTDPYPY